MRHALVWILPLVLAGCSSKQKPVEPEPFAISTPLELDPTDEYDLPSWWTNGEALLHLAADGTYAMYEGINRYHDPVQRGRWWQHSYAAVWLEPYAELSDRKIRTSIRRIDEAFVLEAPGLEPMMALEGPPPVLEDRLLGRWRADFGTLRLDPDLRYVYSTATAGAPQPASLAGHDGAWSIENDSIILRPNSPGLPTMRVRIEQQDDTIVLETADGRFTHDETITEGS